MSKSELDEIMASVQAAISRAYALGRLNALKHVITTMEAEEATAPKPLALMAPQPVEATAPERAPEPAPAQAQEAPSVEPTVVQANPDVPANDEWAGVSAPEADPVRRYRRPAK